MSDVMTVDNGSGIRAMKIAVKAYYDFQEMRLQMGGRLKVKKDGADQKIPDGQGEYVITERDREFLTGLYGVADDQDVLIEKWIAKQLKGVPVWTEFLKNVKGVGPIIAAVLITEFDIHRATTVSKMWQFAGLNPTPVRGMKWVKTAKPKTYQPKDGDVIRRMGDRVLVRTHDMVRGDRLTSGYMSPFNGFLRTKLCGVLAGSFIKSKSPYSRFYYDMKQRYENEDGWSDETKMHRHRAATRYMIKMFLIDLYKAWRELEGLPVRPSYQEEYLDHKHVA